MDVLSKDISSDDNLKRIEFFNKGSNDILEDIKNDKILKNENSVLKSLTLNDRNNINNIKNINKINHTHNNTNTYKSSNSNNNSNIYNFDSNELNNCDLYKNISIANELDYYNKDVDNTCNTNKEKIKENNNEVDIVYSYVINDSQKNVDSNNELISMNISIDEGDNYVLKKRIKKLPFFRYGHFLCLTKNGCILAIGGTDGKKKYGLVEKYCMENKKWKQINIMHFSRSNFCGICTDNNDLFILGGEGDERILKSVEYFDSKINSWRSLPPLNCVRHSASAIFFQNMIFIIGGKDGIGEYGKVHKSVEMLNLKEKNMRWVMCKSLKQARLGLATIVFKGKIYAIGGSTGVKNLSSVEIYDFQINNWVDGPNMNLPRSNMVAFIWENHLVVYGGINKHKGDLINSAEIFNEKKNCWELLNNNAKT
ncbi:kelch protein, putative [Plasmodium sp. DRC-Itaito]|nr:kelch protein, putative [Plasmodium sp. DRC-Itaito]